MKATYVAILAVLLNVTLIGACLSSQARNSQSAKESLFAKAQATKSASVLTVWLGEKWANL